MAPITRSLSVDWIFRFILPICYIYIYIKIVLNMLDIINIIFWYYKCLVILSWKWNNAYVLHVRLDMLNGLNCLVIELEQGLTIERIWVLGWTRLLMKGRVIELVKKGENNKVMKSKECSPFSFMKLRDINRFNFTFFEYIKFTEKFTLLWTADSTQKSHKLTIRYNTTLTVCIKIKTLAIS